MEIATVDPAGPAITVFEFGQGATSVSFSKPTGTFVSAAPGRVEFTTSGFCRKITSRCSTSNPCETWREATCVTPPGVCTCATNVTFKPNVSFDIPNSEERQLEVPVDPNAINCSFQEAVERNISKNDKTITIGRSMKKRENSKKFAALSEPDPTQSTAASEVLIQGVLISDLQRKMQPMMFKGFKCFKGSIRPVLKHRPRSRTHVRVGVKLCGRPTHMRNGRDSWNLFAPTADHDLLREVWVRAWRLGPESMVNCALVWRSQEETLMEACSNTRVQLVRQIWVYVGKTIIEPSRS